MANCSHEDLISNIKSGKRVVEEAPKHGHQHGKKPKLSHASKREAIYKGRKIRIRTTYKIEIDGEALTVPFTVSDDGRVHCHGLPNYAAISALDLVRRLIDTSPKEQPDDEIAALLAKKAGGHRS